MVLDGVILSIIVGFFRKGSIWGFLELKLKGIYIFPVLLLIQILVFVYQNQIEFLAAISGYIYIGVYIIGLYFLWMNRHSQGFLLILAGVFLNFLVMFLNGGRMPVSLEAAEVLDPYYTEVLLNSLYAKHTALTESTRLGFLGDVIPLSSPYPKQQVISIG